MPRWMVIAMLGGREMVDLTGGRGRTWAESDMMVKQAVRGPCIRSRLREGWEDVMIATANVL